MSVHAPLGLDLHARWPAPRAANVHTRSIHVHRPLHTACRHGCADVAAVLLAAGATPDVLNIEHRTPLMCAFEARELSIAALLLEAGASVAGLSPEAVALIARPALVRLRASEAQLSTITPGLQQLAVEAACAMSDR